MQILSKYPLPADILSVDIETIRDNTKVANGKRKIPKNKVAALYIFAQNTIGITNDVNYVKTNIKFLVDEYKNILKNLEYIESQMVEALSKLEEKNYITSIKGISNIFAADLIGELGNISRFRNWKQIRKYAGYNFSDNTKIKNIYDMAGNLYEWTTEYSYHNNGTGTKYVAIRGGSFFFSGTGDPVSFRNCDNTVTTADVSFGFRVVLYVK